MSHDGVRRFVQRSPFNLAAGGRGQSSRIPRDVFFLHHSNALGCGLDIDGIEPARDERNVRFKIH